ncbi:cobyrinic acid A,C-diamide synthase [bacterium BMS3Abin07]|nr:cobyrinic acid A,C-diamide synthase [bacterium BMS3Abin07]HDL20331.1 hydrogenobyrinic acid a,c-diamide synthase (glutamine-hydrolyzing) [Nitrospirota bacterium]HDO22680.1 hydrogenobyrinic acid a,c-diamide synthase (glutamine-hydrolyzing) [Nitrospirota bacterium]HDZ89036.1 hydrogenobyrinic acid a,c-diamide synthase (glutamine-hydrolyzing) [Nitrospirota bacterium]
MKYSIPRVVVAGLKGGSGKTTLSLGLLSLLNRSGRKIVPFKKGPDYIDPGWLARASGRPCYNLDAFLFPGEVVAASFVSHSMGHDGALVEGNRGLFDGMDERGTFSTARLAKSISAPVLLAVDCTKATTTIAAIIRGITAFDRDLVIGGVVLNQLAGDRHEQVIRRAVEMYTDARVVGAIRRQGRLIMGERHLGLIPHQEAVDVDTVIKDISDLIEKSVDVSAVVDMMDSAPSLDAEQNIYGAKAGIPEDEKVRVGVIKDAAFQFYYPENLNLLELEGADIVEINALMDGLLPDIDILYIGGGFPETQADILSGNTSLLDSIKHNADNGLPVYAECGGLMYLGESIEFGGKVYGMSGVLPIKFIVEEKPVAHGYTIVEVRKDNPYFEAGLELRGHEFHYSRITELGNREDLKLVFKMKRGGGIRNGYDGVVYKNVFATYTHLHALGSPEWVKAMINVAISYKNQ